MEQQDTTGGVKAAILAARDDLAWIQASLDGLELKGDHRHRVPGQLFDLSIEHHSGIIMLISMRRHASAFALVRSALECFVRGAWLHHCASEEELKTFVEKDCIALRFGALVDAIEAQPAFAGKFLSTVKESAWNAMNGYTHGGIHQISRRLQGSYIEPGFDDASILEVIQFCRTMALIAFGQIAGMAGKTALVDQAGERMKG